MNTNDNAQPGDKGFSLPQNLANYTQLSPLSFLKRFAEVYPSYTALIHGEQQRTYSEVYTRCKKLASSLTNLGIGTGDVVSIIAPNIPELYEAHFAIPMCGAILNAINTRLEARTIAHILEHSEAKVLLVDRDSTDVIREAIQLMEKESVAAPVLIVIHDLLSSGEAISVKSYEALVADGQEQYDWQLPADEWASISLNYTSGTTGNPKGVVYHHRGAYLNALSNITGWHMGKQPLTR